MQYILFHKNDKVANVEFTDNGTYKQLNGYYNQELMPPGTRVHDAIVHDKFEAWLKHRFLPQKRTNRTKILVLADCINIEQLINYCYGLSINDCYWFKPVYYKDLKPFWEDINFFRNGFCDDTSNILIFDKKINNVNLVSPDLTTSGECDKFWKIENDNFYLYKIGRSEFNYIDSLNECLSSKLANILGLNNAGYNIDKLDDGRVYSKSKCFTDEDTEFFNFAALSVENKTIGKNGVLRFIKENNLQKDLDKLLIHDYILSVVNRDFSNIGFLRDSNTLEIKGLAPVFSGGCSLWYDYKESGIGKIDEARTFDSSHEHQIKLVKDFDGIDIYGLSTFIFELRRAYEHFDGIDNVTANKIVDEVSKRIENIQKMAGIFKKEEKPKNSFGSNTSSSFNKFGM